MNERRERELEQRIYEFNIQKDKIVAKAKEEARQELEKEKKEFEEQIMKIKKQEVALVKKNYA